MQNIANFSTSDVITLANGQTATFSDLQNAMRTVVKERHKTYNNAQKTLGSAVACLLNESSVDELLQNMEYKGKTVNNRQAVATVRAIFDMPTSNSKEKKERVQTLLTHIRNQKRTDKQQATFDAKATFTTAQIASYLYTEFSAKV